MRKLKLISFNLALLFFLLIVVELFLRITNPNYQYYYRTHPGQPDLQEVLGKTNSDWLEPDEQLGWVCRQEENLKFPSPPRTDVVYKINKQGFRNTFNFNDSISKDKKRILLLGDSFMFGIYLQENETVVSKLQAAKGDNYVFYSVAIPAWGLDQIYLAYKEYVDLIKPDQVILSFIDDDLMRSMEILFHGCGRKPCLKIDQGELVANYDNPQWWEYLCWNNQIGNRFLLAHYQSKAAELGQYFLNDIIIQELAAGRKPGFIRIPALVDLKKKEARAIFSMQQLMDRQGVEYVELYDQILQLGPLEYSRYYIPNDGHFTEIGAALLADEIGAMID